MNREEIAASKFACSERERAVFEAGIKLGALYHQFVGTAVGRDNVESLESAMLSAVLVQPYVIDARVNIRRDLIPPDNDSYSYTSLTGEMIDASVTVSVSGNEVTAEMRYDADIGYCLMYVSGINRFN